MSKDNKATVTNSISSLYFGTYSEGPDGGIFAADFCLESGKIHLNCNIPIPHPSYLQLHQQTLYAVSELVEFEGENGGLLSTVSTTNHQILTTIPTHGKLPCHLCMTDKHLFVANYSEGSLSIYSFDYISGLNPSFQSIHHFGKSVNAHRQRSAHVHFVTMDPSGDYLAVCDLGLDQVLLYPYTTSQGLSTNAISIPCPPGAGPRHLTFSQNGNYLYVLTELTNTILVYEYYKGEVVLLQKVSTLPDTISKTSTAAAIRLSPDGTKIVASNRGHDSLAIFTIERDGMLTFSHHLMTGKCPRDFNFSPCGNWLLVANQEDDSVFIYQQARDTYLQTDTITLPKPVCILFG